MKNPTNFETVVDLIDSNLATDGTGCLVKIYPPGGTFGLIQLEDHQFTIGRADDCEIRLEDDSVSRYHATLRRVSDGYLIVDLESTNGTYVNFDCIRERVLEAGDRIRIGNRIFKFLSAQDIEAQYHDTVYKLMITDGLTSVCNKRYMLDTLERDLARSRRYQRPLSLIMMDIDRFKEVNDNYGHLAGDEVLQEFARRLRRSIHQDEIFARYGGEEFSMILAETNLESARAVANQLRKMIAAECFETNSGELQITSSFGVAWTEGDEEITCDELIYRADEKLYQAKRNGRNLVCA